MKIHITIEENQGMVQLAIAESGQPATDKERRFRAAILQALAEQLPLIGKRLGARSSSGGNPADS